ncbi:hypothetical protein [Gandjariella thermophila]|uniref:PIN domain-containing protein n=1 Tax=Gandjariella thermophila TaxID=1931992 RepID=A0A4D4JH91_9PSEU|nr:hypothetical protein [Gandjariella thermophila]GDY33659.1 hypothetical protein GTS_52920 [Gandjariella thermophila]
MTVFLFPDNTALCNFAAVDHLDLLRSALNHRGRWTAAVAYEAERSARLLAPLRKVTEDGWMGQPIEITDPTEIQRVHRIRRVVFGGTDDQPLKHLGEAETCFLLLHRPEFTGSWWISDDREALRYARHQGIVTRETIDLISVAVINGDVSSQEAFDLMQRMVDQGRHLRLPASPAELQR